MEGDNKQLNMDITFVEIPHSYELRNTAIGKDKDVLLLLVKIGFFEDDSVYTVVTSLDDRNLQKQLRIQDLNKILFLSIPEKTKVEIYKKLKKNNYFLIGRNIEKSHEL